MKKYNNTLLLIDPQNDFMDIDKSSLPVKGAVEDMRKVIKKMSIVNFDNIVVTLDTHYEYDIAHNIFWKDENGNHPKPFTVITAKDLISGKWKPVDESKIVYCLDYLNSLNIKGKYSLIIWPTHCVINSWGHKVYQPLKESLTIWENANEKKVKYFKKGENPLTEHYSAVKAEVVIEEDRKTDINKELIEQILLSKNIYIGGEAFTHCVYSTVRDIANEIKTLSEKPNLIIYENATSPVYGFEDKVVDIKNELKDLGVIFKLI